MSMTYMEAISIGFPNVQCHCIGDGSVYEDIVVDNGTPLPTKEALDVWILANEGVSTVRKFTKYEFRKLFTLTERIAVDNYASNPNIPAQYKPMMLTLLKDLELSGDVCLDNPDVIQGVYLLEQIGLINAGRAERILSNTPPP